MLRRVPRGDRHAERARHRHRLHEVERVGQVAEALAEEERGRDRVEPLGADLAIARAADVPGDPGGQQHLVRVTFEKDVLQSDLEVVEAGHRLAVIGVEQPPVAAEAEAEVGAEPFRKLTRDVGRARRRLVALATQLDAGHRRQRQLVGDEGIVGGERRGKEALAGEAVREGRVGGAPARKGASE